MNEITVAPPIPGLFVVEDAVWKIKADGRIVIRFTDELHPWKVRHATKKGAAPADVMVHVRAKIKALLIIP